MIGSVLDKYEVLQKLGEGATATVYRGRHLAIGKDVAIKVLHPHLSASSRYRERFNREARAVGRLSHQNIVSILDYSGQNADECYIVTELVDGLTLQELLQERGRLPSEIAAMAAADLASALAFAHAAGIIHRDIKPENVMLRRDGRVKLMDFGVARVLDESSITLDGSLLGSPAYMSPQQALDESLDGRSDLFSLGTVLFHGVTGHVPFAGTNASVILRNIIEANRPEVLELAPGASPKLAGVIDRLLQPRPDDRFPTATDAHDALVACLAEVRLPLDHPSINLRAYLVDPDACEAALDAHLRLTLLEVGKERLASGDHLGALQLFNRLLAIDEDNAEVIALIQSLHQGPVAEPRRVRGLVGALAATLLALGGAAAWWTWGRPTEPPPEPAPSTAKAATQPPAPAVVETVPAPPPEPTQPTEDPPPTPPVRDHLAPVSRVTTTAASVSAPVAQVDVRPAEVVLNVDPIADLMVWVDGEAVGKRFGGTPDDWVGTESRPLRLDPGQHLIVLKNRYIEDWKETVIVSAGQRLPLNPILKKLKVQILVDPKIPDECKLTVGNMAYEPLSTFRTFPLLDPLPDTMVVFDCPPPIGHIEERLGVPRPGEQKIIPTPGKDP